MDAGSLKYRIEIKHRAFLQESDYGGVYESSDSIVDQNNTGYNSIFNKWANIKWLQAKERLQGGIFSSVKQAIFTVRYSNDLSNLNSRDSITYDNEDFEIQSLAYKGHKAFIEIIATLKE